MDHPRAVLAWLDGAPPWPLQTRLDWVASGYSIQRYDTSVSPSTNDR
jgi:hypothetical protein